MLALGKMRVSGIGPKSWLLRQVKKSRSLRERYGESSEMESEMHQKQHFEESIMHGGALGYGMLRLVTGIRD